ncbi:DeoR/GlpR family DNA-binding transcription regulator [Paenibacillus sp. WQ 127069]|uniref:DeoR/GlpR family DNA-binding transcription regulator n=1 Tax=Paenibacillus baimaensis TaxID=2982185 RepID=A0ABT2UKV3_9BACL|nr:DeoR/GlpR family DNA-binding transcription regulator [Paenibacillus sp. WQ 127069]MCU6794502.1 DeoR/GlpR family DNA-binding transcription regulator [Paenibacillus sp. WQ 127069]
MENNTSRRVETLAGNDRKKEIVNLLEELGVVRVSDMSKRFGVTEETIRRDLERLENEGSLLRTHGGAVLNRKEGPELPVLQRELVQAEEKRSIGEYAASLVKDGEVIALDASTTCLQMAKYFPNKEITVITYSIPIAYELIKKTNIQIFLIGGYLDRHSLGNTGTPAEKMLEGYHVDKFFFSCQGFDLQRGISEPYEAHVQLKKSIASISDQLILLADSSKFQRKSLVRLIGLEEVSMLVTDNHMPVEALQEMDSSDINVVVVS